MAAITVDRRSISVSEKKKLSTVLLYAARSRRWCARGSETDPTLPGCLVAAELVLLPDPTDSGLLAFCALLCAAIHQQRIELRTRN